MRTREEILEERRQVRAEYGELFEAISSLLFRHDPIGIAFENPNADEYDPEAGTILPRLRSCRSADDVLLVVHQEFVRWFDEETAGSPERYSNIASEIWDLWVRSGGLLHPSIIKLLPGASG
jgi:hypothetical protein